MDCLPPVRVVTLVPAQALTGRDGGLTLHPGRFSTLKSPPVGVVVHMHHLVLHVPIKVLLFIMRAKGLIYFY